LLAFQRGVQAAFGDEFAVGADFGDAALVEHDDPVGVARRRNAVRNHERGTAFPQFLQARQDEFLRLRVDRGEAVVEQQHRRVPDEPARQARTLFLPARKRHAPLAHQRFEPVRKAADGRFEIGALRRAPDFFRRPLRIVVGNILRDMRGEEERVLRHHGDFVAHLRDRQHADVAPVEIDGAGRWVEQADDEAQQGRLAGTDPAEQRNHLALFDVERHIIERT